MSVSFNWKIINLERNIIDGGVVVAHYCLTGSKDGVSLEKPGSAKFYPDPLEDGFVPFNSLDKQTVLNWIWDQTELFKDNAELQIEAKLDEIIGSKTVLGVPWVED